MKKRIYLVASILLILLACWYGTPNFDRRSQNLRMFDFIDQPLIVAGLLRTKSFSETWAWWTGPWVGYTGRGQINSFYRPLTSLIWYTQYRIWGINGANQFMAMHRLYNLAVCFLALAFFRRVLGFRTALLAVMVWASSTLLQFTFPAPIAALSWWKDDPDLWISLTVLLTCWSLLSYWWTSKTHFLVAAFFLELLGIAVKEMAYVTPLLAALVLWSEWYRAPFKLEKRHWIPVVALLAIIPVAYVFRTWALQGPGFRFGSNGSWLSRWIFYVVGGRPANLFVTGQAGAVGAALFLLGVPKLLRRKFALGAVFLSLGTGVMLWTDWYNSAPFGTALSFISFSDAYPVWKIPIFHDTLLSLTILGIWIDGVQRRDRRQIFGYSWVFLSYLPLLTAPITEHALYLPSMGWGIVVAVAAERFVTQLKIWFAEIRDSKMLRFKIA